MASNSTSVGTVTLDNYEALARARIDSYKARGITLSGNEEGAILNAFRELVGKGNGFFTVNGSGAAAPRDMGEAELLAQPGVRAATAISGATSTVVRTGVRAGKALGLGIWDSIKDGADAIIHGPASLWEKLQGPLRTTIISVAAGAAVVGVAYVVVKNK